MSMDFKVRTWLWWVLVAVLVAGIGYLVWYSISSSKTVTITTSPSPVQTVTPSPAATATPTAATGETTTTTKTTTDGSNQSTTKTYDGYISDADPSFRSDQYCVYKISFEYPSDYPDPSFVAGTLTVFKDKTSTVRIEPAGDKESDCNPGTFASPREYYDMWHHGEILEGPTYSEKNGNSIVIWVQKYDSGTPTHPELATTYSKQAFLMNGTRYVLISTSYTISHSEGITGSRTTQFDSAFDTIVNSFKIQ